MILSNTKDIVVELDKDKLWKDFNYFKTKQVDNSCLKSLSFSSNYIIKYFQQDAFYKIEKELWNQSKELRERIIFNRCKYLRKNQTDLTTIDILSAFKIMGLHYGYSHFNPLWFKWFIQQYNVKSCYDPCGGWGHRLLGSLALEKYIYNDFSKTTKQNVDKMIDFFNIKNATTYQHNAVDFIPSEEFDAMFTCPPYFNLEHYECGDFKNINEFNNFILKLYDIFSRSENCKIFGLVLKEQLFPKNLVYASKFLINFAHSHLIKNKKNLEYLYVFKK